VGIDLGGSSAKIGLISKSGEVLAEVTVPTPTSQDPEVVLAPFLAEAERLRRAAADRGCEVVTLGCGVPGNLDETRQRIELNNIRALDGFALGPWLAERTGLPVALDNDASAAAIGETALVTTHQRRVLFDTVGSGIGVVLVVDGAIVRIMKGQTGEAGNVIVSPESVVRCLTGCRGCLETVAAAPAIAREGRRVAEEGRSEQLGAVLRTGGEISGADVSEAARRGDPAAAEIIRQAGRWLGVGLASWAPIYLPELVLLGGGVAQAGENWLEAAVGAMRELGAPLHVDGVIVRRATLGNRAGMVGAGLMALRQGS
jgi:glucokinase